MATMSLSPEDILNLAESLCTSPEEASYRFSVSRAYYANYHEAKRLAEDLGLQLGTGMGVHQSLISSFRGHGHSHEKIAGRLNRLKIARVKSDYRLSESITKKEAEFLVCSAKSLLGDLQRLSAKR